MASKNLVFKALSDDRKAQTVAVRFLVTNTGATCGLQFVKLVAIEASGEQHPTYDVGFGTTPRSSVPTGVPVKAAGILKGFGVAWWEVVAGARESSRYPERCVALGD